ncbi:MAG TPA: DUF1800 family protein, partial [Chthoniobacter sp.]|nr:DUF1800 family protein [Chthoniobacter sp.]
NNGLWGSGTPDVTKIGIDTFSVRWSGQVQPQYTEEYTFLVLADDGCTLTINGQVQPMKTVASTFSAVGTYDYTTTTGDAIVTYSGSVVRPGSYVVGETIRVDPTSGNLSHGTNSTYSYDGTTGIMTVDYSNLTNILPGGFAVGETIELDPTSGSLTTLAVLPYVITSEPSNSTFTVNVGTGLFITGTGTINIADTRDAVITKAFATGATYTYANSGAGPMTVTYSAIAGVPASSFAVGQTVELDPTTGSLSALSTTAYSIVAATPTTFTVNVGLGFGTTGGNVYIAAPANGVIPESMTTAFAINFGAGKYNTGTGNINVEIVNQELKDWSSMGNERYVRIPMVGGRRYDIKLDYYENTSSARCQLSWYSPSQPKQIIPSSRLYPSSLPQAGSGLVSDSTATGVVGGSFSYTIAPSNGGTVTISGNPAWMTLNNGVLSGTPPPGSGGDYQILITTTNANGTGTSVLNVHIDENTATVTREYWNGIAGNSVASIPVGTPPSGTATLTSLQGPTNFGDNYGARVRGYITAPSTGNYYFWIAASNAAEFWLSNDSEPVNKIRRANLTAGSATPLAWANGQKSPWLALEAGRKYYFEILHKAGAGTGDNVAVGWLKPGQTGNVPSEVVPAPVLSPYYNTPALANPGTLYVSTMLSQGGAVTNGVGTSTLRLSPDETTATMTYSYHGLSGPITSQHIHVDPYLGNPSTIVYDIDTPATPGDGLQPDGSYKWTITPVGTLSAADIREIIKQGKAYINLHTALYPAGEIRGNYTLAIGSRTFTPPPAPPSWADDHTTDAGAVRFLTQATFGASVADIAALKAMASYEAWIDDQFTQPASYQLPEVIRTENASAQGGAFDESLTFNTWWWNSISGPDQLRQRVAFALSEIHVVSGQGPLDNNAMALSYFYDKLADNAFGNFRQILEDTTMTPGMGRYLDMLRNDKPDLTVGRIPNENYAREIKQLFSIGLYRLWPDGTLILNSKDAPIDTYTQREIVGFAHAFTGWDYGYDGTMHSTFTSATSWIRQMRETPGRHFTGPKRILNNEVLPGLLSINGQPLDPYATHTSTQFNNPEYQALPAQELDATHDQLFNHPNVGPFVCRQLIQRLVTSNPSRDYLYRVVQKFNDNGSGVRGDMKAVVKAILLDFEARATSETTKPAFGKQREPLLRVAAAARALRPTTWSGNYTQGGTPTITIDLQPPGTPHKLATGNNVFLNFTSGTPMPFVGSYAATVVDADTFTVQAPGYASGTYNIPANSTVCTVTMSNHWLQVGHKIYVDFTTGTAHADADLDNVVYTVTTATAETGTNGTVTFDIAAGEVSATARTGNVIIPRFSPGSYTITSSGLPFPQDRRITMDTNFNHNLNPGEQVQLNFYGGNPLPQDTVVTVESVLDVNTYTALVGANGTNNYGTNQGFDQVYQFPLSSQPLTRSGTVGSRSSTYLVGNTDLDLAQSPIYSPTVFNYFLPDFKFPGTLASQGITTPEFQTTAETTVVRQANFLYNGIFNPGNTNGISSFKSGGHALVLDYSPWMGTGNTSTDVGLGPPATTSEAWTSNTNLPVLINQWSTLFLAGQLPAGASPIIQNFLTYERLISSMPVTPQTTPVTVTTAAAHGLTTGQQVVLTGIGGGTFRDMVTTNTVTINATWAVTVTGPNTFTINGVYCSVAPTAAQLTSAKITNVVYSNTAPTDTQKRDRLRAVMHLILTSPDYTIQR